MNKAEYLKLVREIGKTVRKAGYRYGKMYSKPVVASGYNTKLYMIRGQYKKVAKAINEKYGHLVEAKAYVTSGYYYYQSPANNVMITPLKKVKINEN